MKRSRVNQLVREAIDFFAEHRFSLPPFAYWTPDDWSHKGEESREIAERQLGWDVTDYGQGRFDELGLLLFTLRNGSPADLKTSTGKLYAEKIMIVGVEQVTPMHHHWWENTSATLWDQRSSGSSEPPQQCTLSDIGHWG